MRHLHITGDLLRAEAENDGATLPLVRRLLAHLYHLCPTCRDEMSAYRQEMTEPGELDVWYEEVGQAAEDDYTTAFARAAQAASQRVSTIDAERKEAAEKLAELLALPVARRLDAITQAPLEYQGLALAALLLEASLGQMPGTPKEALALAQLAKVVLSHSGLSSLATELYARASAHVANALRTLGRLPEASARFGDARFLLRHQPVVDPLVSAEIDSMEGSLRRDQRRFEQAAQLLRRAALSYQATGQPREEALTLLKMGSLSREQGNPAEAAKLALRVLDSTNAGEEPRLCFYSRHNLAHALCELGKYEDARAVLAENRSLQLRYGDPLSRLRLQWVEGKIAHGLGEYQDAEILFLLARHGFERHEIACDAALVSLELAALYLGQRRTADVKALAAEMVVIFEGQEIHREAATALHLFRDAAELEQVTLGLVRNLATYLVHASRDPTFAYQAGS